MTDTATIPDTLHPFSGSRRFSASFKFGPTEFEVAVRTPDLCSCATSMWGDWGPMYTCQLEPEQCIEIRYRRVHDGRAARYTLNPPTMALNSTMLAAEREKCPFYLEFVDVARSLKFQVYLNREGEFDHLEVERVHPALDFRSLVFRSLPDSGANDNPLDDARRSA